ncbi:hypothetical protein FHG87_025096, partial [Trinorchestia longiramus]
DSKKIEEITIHGFHAFRYQLYVLMLGCVATYMPGLVVVAIPFLAYEPQHRCLIPQCEKLNSTSYDQTFLNFSTP